MKKLTLFALTWPIFIELSLHMLMGNADTFMLSQYSDHAVAAVGVANQLMSMINIMFGFVAAGTTILVSQSIGAKQLDQAHQTATTSLSLNLIMGIILSIALVLASPTALRMLGLEDHLIPYAMEYITVTGSFMFVQALLLTVSAIIKSHGFTRDAMLITVGMNIINVIGNYLFIFGPFGIPVLGVTGVAISTVASRVIGLLAMILILRMKIKQPLRVGELLRPRRNPTRNLLRIGIPSAGENLSYNISQLVITGFITLLGTTALVTRIYTVNVMMFIMLCSVAIGQGTQILVARMVGGNEYDQAYRRGLRSLWLGMAASFLMAGVFNLVGVYVLELFTTDPDVIKLGQKLLLLSFILEPGRAFNLILIGALRAAGDVRFPVYMGVISMWGVAVPVAYLLGISFGFGLMGIFTAFIMDEWLRGLLMLWRWRKRKWQHLGFLRNVQENAEA